MRFLPRYRHLLIATVAATFATAVAHAVTADSTAIERRYIADNPRSDFSSASFRNPAIVQYRTEVSTSSVGAAWDYANHSADIYPQLGTGQNGWNLNATTVTKYRTSTLRGNARYANGQQRNPVWNETSDPQIVYPYFSADSVGGDLRYEQYSFMGGYADHRGPWSWGGELSYTAGHYYRAVDPRPRNVTGQLDACIGAAYTVAQKYMVGAAFSFRKYKQTNNIAFYSEMGKDKIYHLTGLGNHYARFSGACDNAYFNGYRWGAMINMYPASGNGFFLTGSWNRFTFEKVLTSLNNLPMARVEHTSWAAQAGYVNSARVFDHGVRVDFANDSRRGTENLFGDASANVYPQIGSLDMYSHKRTLVSATGFLEFHDVAQRRRLTLLPSLGYSSSLETYAVPASKVEGRFGNAALKVNGATIAGSRAQWLLEASADIHVRHKLASTVNIVHSTAIASLDRITSLQARTATCSAQSYNASLNASRSINRRFAIRASAQWHHTSYEENLHSDELTVSLALIF